MARNPEVDGAFEGSLPWAKEAERLREILLACGLGEELKWGQACYVHEGRNICIIQRMNDFLALLFFKGALLKDPDGVLERQGPNSRTGFRMRFTGVEDVARLEESIWAFVREAIEVEKAGLKVERATTPAYPMELSAAFRRDPDLKAAFRGAHAGAAARLPLVLLRCQTVEDANRQHRQVQAQDPRRKGIPRPVGAASTRLA